MKNLGPFRLNPRGEYNTTTQYQVLDLITYKGSSYICINDDIIDGVSNIGIPPVGHEKSSVYYQLSAQCGDKGDRAEKYDGFIKLTDGNWDYNASDKAIIKATETPITLSITNVYDGCCGMLLTDAATITLPERSDTSINFNYIMTNASNCYYMYTFVYCGDEISGRFIWNKNYIEGVLL